MVFIQSEKCHNDGVSRPPIRDNDLKGIPLIIAKHLWNTLWRKPQVFFKSTDFAADQSSSATLINSFFRYQFVPVYYEQTFENTEQRIQERITTRSVSKDSHNPIHLYHMNNVTTDKLQTTRKHFISNF